MNYTLNALLVFVTLLSTKAQTVNEIKNSSDYIWGVGISQNIRDADKDAMVALNYKISMSVLNHFKGITQDIEVVKKIIDTYNNTIQQQSKRIVTENPDKTEVLRYFQTKDLNKIFEGRANKIVEYLKLAEKNEEDYKIGDAVRYYYWALVLLKTHPFNEQIKLNTDKDSGKPIIADVSDKINHIFSDIGIAVKSIDDNAAMQSKSIYFNINYKDKPVENFDYTYWNGKTWTNMVSVKNGNAFAEFIGAEGMNLGSLRIKAEYIFENKSMMDHELYNVIQNTEIPYFPQAEIEEAFMKVISDDISMVKEKPIETQKEKPESNKPTKPFSTETNTETEKTSTPATDLNSNTIFNEAPYQKLIDKFIDAIETQNYESIKNDLTKNGQDGFEHLIKYGKAKIIDKNTSLKFLQLENTVLVRSIPMLFTFENNDRQFVEEVTFTINTDFKIDNIAFSLSRKALDDIMSHTKWPEENKLQLIQFMENYKTAYALERVDYIESIFSNDALIIIGQVLEKAEPLDGMYGSFKKDIEYIRLSKAEYMDRLRTVFSQNEFVNIQFEGNEIRKKNNSNEYGIQIVQNYYSTNYADKGYLFLYIDMRDSVHPRILVRSWQPEKNPDGSVPGLSDFF